MPLILNGSTGISGTDGSAGTPAVQGTDTNTGMFFPAADQIAFAEGGVEAMRLDASGNVGINTSSPGARLDVKSAARVSGPSSGYIDISHDGLNGAFTNNTGGMLFYAQGSSNGNDIVFHTNNSARMRVRNDGYVNINTSAVNAMLTVDGSGPAISTAFAYYAQSGGATATGYAPTQSVAYSIWAGDRISASEFNARSDGRLKKDVTPIPASDAWQFVQSVTPVHYKWINGPDDGHKFGFIAQDVVKAGFPNLVGQYPDSNVQEVTDADGFTSPAGVMLSVNYDQIVPVLASALRDALAQIEELKARVAALEAR